MMSYPPHVVAAVATLAAAFIAGCVAYLVSVLSKEQKISEFRQQWIDALRSDIAEFVGEFTFLSVTLERVDGRGVNAVAEAFEKRYENLVRVRSLHARIALRVNAKKDKSFLLALEALGKMDFKPGEHKMRAAAINEFVDESQRLLKREWTRVKRGEWTFIVTKMVAGLAVLAVVVAASWWAYRTLAVEQPDVAESPAMQGAQ